MPKPLYPQDGEVWLVNTPESRRLAASMLPPGEDVRLLDTDSGEVVVVVRQEDMEVRYA